MKYSLKMFTRIGLVATLTLTLTLPGMASHTARIKPDSEAARNSTSTHSASKIFVSASNRMVNTSRRAGDRSMDNATGGTTYTWVGTHGDGLWSIPENWNPEGPPGPGDTAVINCQTNQFSRKMYLDHDDIEVSRFIMVGDTVWDKNRQACVAGEKWAYRPELFPGSGGSGDSYTLKITNEFTFSDADIFDGARVVAGENCVVTISGVTNLGRNADVPSFLTINGSGSLIGHLIIGTGSALTVGEEGDFTFSSLAGAGTVSTSTLAGPGTVTINGTMLWESGTMGDGESDTGTTVVGTTGTLALNLSGSPRVGCDRILGRRRVINSGRIIAGSYPQRGTLCGHDFTLENEGTIRFGNSEFGSPNNPSMGFSQCGDNPGTIRNQSNGTFTKMWGSEVLAIAHNFINSGKLEIGHGGFSFPNGLTQDSGSISVGSLGKLLLPNTQLNLHGGELSGEGLIDGNVLNGSTIKPGGSNRIGTLTVAGNYTQTPKGKIEIEIGGSSRVDQLITNSTSTTSTTVLAGTLDLRRLDVVEEVVTGSGRFRLVRRVNHGPFQPRPNDAFSVLRYLSRAGEFSKVRGLVIKKGLIFTLDYQTNELRLVTPQRR